MEFDFEIQHGGQLGLRANLEALGLRYYWWNDYKFDVHCGGKNAQDALAAVLMKLAQIEGLEFISAERKWY